MKLLQIAFLLILSCINSVQSFALQDCSTLVVEGIFPDTTNVGQYMVRVHWDAPSKDLLSYPRVVVVTDCNGDTAATGKDFYFGQLGTTTQDYPVTVQGKGSLNCFPLKAVFLSMNSSGSTDTCVLVFGTTSVDTHIFDTPELRLLPNPVTNMLEVTSNLSVGIRHYSIRDLNGTTTAEGTMYGPSLRINTSCFSPGVYMISLDNKASKLFVVGYR